MNFIRPVSGKISSPFGWRVRGGKKQFHSGVDIAAPKGSAVIASGKGIVLKTYYNDSGGKQMILLHPNSFQTGYAHLNSYEAAPGEFVKAGDVIAYSGDSGAATGAHLHFTMRNKKGDSIDPLARIRRGKIMVVAASAFLLIVIIVLFIYIKRSIKQEIN